MPLCTIIDSQPQDCKDVIGLLSTLTKNSADPSKQKIANLLRRWKQVTQRGTDSTSNHERFRISVTNILQLNVRGKGHHAKSRLNFIGPKG